MNRLVSGIVGFLFGGAIAFMVVAALVPHHNPHDVDAAYWFLGYYLGVGLPVGGIIGTLIALAIGEAVGRAGQSPDSLHRSAQHKMTCQKCGRQMPVGWRTCKWCGGNLK
jgi:MFS family permease